jgi:hypothetical protein
MRSPLFAAVALAAGIVLGYLLAQGSVRRAPDSAPVVQAVRKIARLATVEIEVSDVVRYEEVRTILVFDVPKNATLRLRGRVLGGFDVMKGFSVAADDKSKTVRVTLPPPQVISVDERLEWFDEKSGWLNPITPADRTRWQAWARGALGRAAKDADLYGKAIRHARELIVDGAAALGWKAEVTIGAAGETKPLP